MKCKNCGLGIKKIKLTVTYELGEVREISYTHADGYARCDYGGGLSTYAEPSEVSK